MVVKQKEEYEKMKTSELIDLLDNLKDEEYDLVWEVFSEREVYRYLQEQITENDSKIEGMQKGIDKIKKHSHSIQGNLLVPL